MSQPGCLDVYSGLYLVYHPCFSLTSPTRHYLLYQKSTITTETFDWRTKSGGDMPGQDFPLSDDEDDYVDEIVSDEEDEKPTAGRLLRGSLALPNFAQFNMKHLHGE